MTPSFFIEKSFVKKIEFEMSDNVLDPLTLYSQLKTNLGVDIETKSSEKNTCNLVEVRVNLSLMTDNDTPVYTLLLCYVAIVGIPEDDIHTDDLNDVFKVQVPKVLLDSIRAIVWQLTREAGFPFMMRDDTFDHPVPKINELSDNGIKDDMDPSALEESLEQLFGDAEIVGFQMIMDNLNEMEVAREFLDIYVKQVGESSLSEYVCLPIYKCYYRFFTPIAYHHPDFEECEEDVWPMLFQMLYGSFQAKCKAVDVGDELPEIQFSFRDYVNRNISSLTVDEVEDLLTDLMIDALTNTSVNLIGYRIGNNWTEKPLVSGRLISKQDFFHLFDALVDPEKPSFLDEMYERIKECDIQTVFYRY
ncbi:MAG: protein-export chaperone SecB [Bacteroidales bacterium]|nr:protein-export chaperone SecB [Bacteroidales bacterium]